MNLRPLLLVACAFAGASPSQTFAADAFTAPPPRREAFTLYTENDKYFAGTDRHYTNGFKLTWLHETNLDQSQEFVQSVARWLPWMNPQQRGWHYKVGFTLGHNTYTPTDTDTSTIVANDRPYSAWFYAGIILHAQIDDQLRLVEIDLGIVGPAALGEEIQNGWHKVINVAPARGWANQIRNEPGVQISWERRYRSTVWPSTDSFWQADSILRHRVTIGNVATHAALGASLRVGWRLPKDFGADLIRAGGGGIANANSIIPYFAYVFASGETRAVARDITLDGNSWQASHSVRKRPVVADLNLGFALGTQNFQLTYTQNYRTVEFYGQPQRDVFGSISVALLY